MIRLLKEFKGKLFSNIESIPEALNKKHYPSIDGLRGIAILNVILCHASFGLAWHPWIDGTIGVHIFFIISGFLITTLLLKERVKKGKVSFKNFYIRRVLRIFPVAYLYIFTVIILSHIFQFQLGFKNVLTSLLYLKNFPTGNTWQTGHFWTLSVEEQFYLFVPVLLILNANRFLKIIFVVFLLVPVIDYIGFHNIGIFYTNRIVHVITFIFLALLNQGTLFILTGCLLSILIFKKIIIVEKFKNQYYLSTILFICAGIVHYSYVIPIIPYFSSIVFAVLMGLVIVVNLYENNFLTAILSHPILVKLGILSYSLYIWQQIFTTQQPWAGRFKYSDSIALNMVLLFIVAFCSYYFFERRFLKLKSRFKS